MQGRSPSECVLLHLQNTPKGLSTVTVHIHKVRGYDVATPLRAQVADI